MVKKWVVAGWQEEGKKTCLTSGFFLISVLLAHWRLHFCSFLKHKICQNDELQYEKCFKKVSRFHLSIISFSIASCCVGCLYQFPK